MMNFYRYLFYGLVAIAVLQSIFYYPQLSPVVAAHFNSSGAANGWSSRNVFFAIYLAMIALLVGVFIYLPHCSGKRGKLRMNIPNRDYWLAAQRQQQTIEFVRRQMLILGIVHLLLAIYSVQLAILANLQQASGLHESLWWALGLYFVFVTLWLINLFRQFRKPPDQTE